MPIHPDLKIKLTRLIQESQTISERKKELVIKSLEIIDDEQANKLVTVFSEAKKKLAETEKKYQQEELEIKKQYLQTVNEFTHKDITTAFKQWENSQQKDTDQTLDSLLEDIKKVPETKKHHTKSDSKNPLKKYLIILLLVTAGILFFYFFQKGR